MAFQYDGVRRRRSSKTNTPKHQDGPGGSSRLAVPAAPRLFKSFFQGGFECSSHIRGDGVRLDVTRMTGHDRLAETDYRLASSFGLQTMRDGLRWHLIEKTPGHFDWKSFLPMLHAARETKVQVIWDLMHYGWPDDLDIWSGAFVDRFARFAAKVAQLIKDETDDPGFFTPINEISFFAFAGGEFGLFNPGARQRGDELKHQLVRATIAAIEAVWDVDARSRIVHVDPTINVVADPMRPETQEEADRMSEVQYAAWDMIAGRLLPHLGGAPRYLDIVGVNYYVQNQWTVGIGSIQRDDPSYTPFRELLRANYGRYGRPLFVAETGIEADLRPEWFRYICDEVAAAMASGVPVGGICLYPVMNHPGWDDDRHCPNGLIDYGSDTLERSVYEPLAAELKLQQKRFASLVGEKAGSAVAEHARQHRVLGTSELGRRL